MVFSDAELARFREVFDAYDDNNDGLINAKELIGAMDHLGLHPPASGVEQLMRGWDADGSGSIGFDEFVALCSGTGDAG